MFYMPWTMGKFKITNDGWLTLFSKDLYPKKKKKLLLNGGILLVLLLNVRVTGVVLNLSFPSVARNIIGK